MGRILWRMVVLVGVLSLTSATASFIGQRWPSPMLTLSAYTIDYGIQILAVDTRHGGLRFPLRLPADSEIFWFPDGQRIGIMNTAPLDNVPQVTTFADDIPLTPLFPDTATAPQWDSRTRMVAPSWSTDGTTLRFAQAHGHRVQLWDYHRTNGTFNRRPIALPEGDELLTYHISADNTYTVLVLFGEQNWQKRLRVLDASGRFIAEQPVINCYAVSQIWTEPTAVYLTCLNYSGVVAHHVTYRHPLPTLATIADVPLPYNPRLFAEHPDGAWTAYVYRVSHKREQRYRLVLAKTDNGRQHTLDFASISHIEWRPDSP
jgi:hypothetical protein